jgi:hypothetical protein
MKRYAPLVFYVSLLTFVSLVTLPTPGCAHIQTGLGPVADTANAAGKIEEEMHGILVEAQKANATPNPNTGQPLLSRSGLDQVALAVNKVGHVGLDLRAALDAYQAAKTAGSDVSLQRAAVQQILATVNQALADVGKAIPQGTLQAIDQLAINVLGFVAQIRVGVGL